LTLVIVCLSETKGFSLCKKREMTQVALSESPRNSGTNGKLVKRGICAKTIESSEMKILKKILFGPAEANGLWRLRTMRRS